MLHDQPLYPRLFGNYFSNCRPENFYSVENCAGGFKNIVVFSGGVIPELLFISRFVLTISEK